MPQLAQFVGELGRLARACRIEGPVINLLTGRQQNRGNEDFASGPVNFRPH